MIAETFGLSKLEPEQAYVVYDSLTGCIVHVHQTATVAGSEERSQEAIEVRAMELARQFGHRTDGLLVVRVEPGELDFRSPQRIDLRSRQLVRAPCG